MISGILIVSIVAFVAIISYRRPRFEQRVIKEIPLIDWMNILVTPLLMYLGIVFIVGGILSRKYIEILDINDFYLLAIGVLFMTYTYIGNSIHFVSKVLSRYIPKNKQSAVFNINEVFHGKLSHYLSFVCALLSIFVISLLELNHPLTLPYSKTVLWLLILSGITTGASAGKAVFNTSNWFSGNRSLFYVSILLFTVLLALFIVHDLRITFYPFNLFIISALASLVVAFLVRRAFVMLKFHNKKGFQFLVKFLNRYFVLHD